MATPVLLAHAAVTWTLVGLIWVVQVVHYPLLAAVGEPAYAAYQRRHMQRITWLVAPLMLTELACAAFLLIAPPVGVPVWMPIAGVVLLAAIWLSTVLLQMPAHAMLQDGFDAHAHRRLVRGNWVRTAAWSLRGLLAMLLLI